LRCLAGWAGVRLAFSDFERAARSRIKDASAAGAVGLGYIAGVFCFSMTTEAFALKYLVTFYALMVAALAAQVISAEPNDGLTFGQKGGV
jgi:hypothetical protein